MQSRLIKVAMVAGIALVAAYVGSILTTPAEAQRKVQ